MIINQGHIFTPTRLHRNMTPRERKSYEFGLKTLLAAQLEMTFRKG